MKKVYFFASAAVVALAAAGIVTACGDNGTNPLGGDSILSQCGLTCNENAIVEGDASISGMANVDSFFSAVINYNSSAVAVADGITAPLARIKAQLGVPAAGGAAEIQAALKTKFHLKGDLKIAYAPPKCEVSAKATIEASAQCDATVKPATAEVKCSGRCEADVQVSGTKVSCSGDAKVHCTTPSASVECKGSCSGSCSLDVAAACNGTCNGTCDGTCEVKNSDGSCAGKCEGNCKGKCELSGGGSCSGKCDGECAVETTTGGCDASAKVECFAEPPSANAEIKCDAKCEGEVTPPEVKAECKTSAKANADLKAECTPPSIDVFYEFEAAYEADATNAANFDIFLATFKTEIGAVVAGLKRANIVLKAGANLVASIDGMKSDFTAVASGKTDFKTTVGIPCAIANLAKVPGLVQANTTDLTAKVKASASFVAAFK
jgi:hypothetical protein